MLVSQFSQSITDLAKNPNLSTLLGDVSKLWAAVQTASSDCATATLAGSPGETQGANGSCLLDIISIIPLATAIQSEINAGGFADVINDINNMGATIELILYNC